jgi:hypothetical protein
MNARIAAGLLALLAGPLSATGPVIYKCLEGASVTYTDRPCHPQARAAELPPLVVTAPPGRAERELARAHQDRIARDAAERDRRDADWVKQHNGRRDREERVRRAIVEQRVIKGMTMDEVRRALGEPDQVATGESYGTAKETWTYTRHGETRTVNFKNAEVISSGGKRKGRGRR